MRGVSHLSVFLVLLLTAVSAQAAEEAKPTPRVRLLVPAYFYPEGPGLEQWERMVKAARDVPIVAIANPASGPGRRMDSNYRTVIRWARASGVTVVGYVATGYAKHPQKDVEADVARWKELYPEIHGIFLDEQSSGKSDLGYYRAVAASARALWRELAVKQNEAGEDPLLVSNPGTASAPEFVTPWSGLNTVCLQENRFGLERYQPPDWTREVPPAQMAGLVYEEPSITRMRLNVEEAIKKRIGYLYVTDRGGANPWDRLPGYWELEVATVRRVNGIPAPAGMHSKVAMTHWAYDAIQQLIQRGLYTGYPDGTFAGKRAFTRIWFAQAAREILASLEAQPPLKLKEWRTAAQDIKALEMLAREFREELGHFGLSPERTAASLNGVRTQLKLPAR